MMVLVKTMLAWGLQLHVATKYLKNMNHHIIKKTKCRKFVTVLHDPQGHSYIYTLLINNSGF